ncbi:MAG: tRNA 4-thiouridine(8) synthase ThiI [Actinomycetota bacterium]|nr:tRNA 4-thiouridine(8) synthase ThiI [Actinomycetota bacterium]
MTPQPCVLLKYGELALKGRNRHLFERHLMRNLQQKVDTGTARVRIWRRQGFLVLHAPAAHEELVERARQVLGISVVQPALRAHKTPAAAADASLHALGERFDGERTRTFAVRARRRDKRFPLTSEKLAAYVGRHVCRERGWQVDLREPEVTIWLEVDRSEVYVSVDRHRGQGGLPVGSSGDALALLSGGFDSPVAAYRAMRRGLHCEFVHFTGAPYTGPSSTYKAYALVRQLSRFQPEVRLHVVAIGAAQRALATAGADRIQVVAHRRLMVRAAETLAGGLGAQALVTGDSLGQVASQTLSNLAAVEQACDLPLLRPLVGWDKDEIITEARRIGTEEVSVLDDEDCCTLLSPPGVATHTRPEHLSGVERRAGLDGLVEAVLANTQVLTLDGEARR